MVTTKAPRGVTTYEAREAVALTGVELNRLRRWTDAEILDPFGGGGKGSRRAYSLRHLVYLVVCDRLHRLGASELTMRKAIKALEYAWLNGPQTALRVGQTVLWLRIHPKKADHEDARIDFAGEFALTTKSSAAPLLTVATHLEVAANIRDGYFGIAIGLLDIVTALEQKTGDTVK